MIGNILPGVAAACSETSGLLCSESSVKGRDGGSVL